MHKRLKTLLVAFFLSCSHFLSAQTSSPIVRFDAFGNLNARIAPGESIRLVFEVEARGAGTLELDLEGLSPLKPVQWHSRKVECEENCTVRDTLILQPSEKNCGLLVFNVVAKFQNGDELYKAFRRVRLDVVPKVQPEPAFTPGRSNTICWRACQGLVHELVHFPLFKSRPAGPELSGNGGDVLCDVVEGLSPGLRYGYFVKTTVPQGQGFVTLLSDTVFSTQDDTPPETIDRVGFTVDALGRVTLAWQQPQDDISSVAEYVILRSELSRSPSRFQAIDTLRTFPATRITPVNYQQVPAEKGRELYLDGKVKILYLPELLSGSAMIQTQNRDRWNQKAEFLSFYLTVPSRIYIAMDPRIDKVPHWVDESFDFIPVKQVRTTRPDGRGLMLFKSKRVFPAGHVSFGGNFADGADFRDFADMMYVVFLQPAKDVLPFMSAPEASYVDSLGADNDLKSFTYKIQVVDAAGNYSESVSSGRVILDLHGRCRPVITSFFDFEDEFSQPFTRGTTRALTVLDPQTQSECVGLRATDSLRFQAVRENVALFSDARPEDGGSHFFDSGWIAVADLPEPLTFTFNFLPTDKDVNFVNGKTYFCRVQGKDVFGNISAWSDTVAAVQDAFPPQDISNLTAKNEAFADAGDGCVRLNWTPATDLVSGVFRYIIYRSADGGMTFTSIDSIPANQTTFCDTLSKLPQNQVFHYRVASVDGVGNVFDFRRSAWEVQIRALRGPFIEPDPTAVVVCPNGLTGVANDTLLIRWPDFDATGVASYEIEITGPDGQVVIKTIEDATASSALCPLNAGDGFYAVRARAHYATGEVSIFSNTLRFKKKETLQPVSNFVVQQAADGSGDFVLSWSHTDGSEIQQFEILVWADGEQEPSVPAKTVPGDSIHVRFDFQDDALTAYECTLFKVRARDCFGLISSSEVLAQYANPAPVFDPQQTVLANDALTVCWQRPAPRVKPDDNFSVLVYVFRDSLSDTPVDSVSFINKNCFTLHNPEPGHNYLFKVRETILDDLGQSCSAVFRSAASRTFVVPFENLPPALSFDVQPLPVPPGTSTGSVFVAWQDTSAKVQAFRVKWATEDAPVVADSSDVIEQDTLLVRGLDVSRSYAFSLISLDSLGQRSEMNLLRRVSFNPPWEFTPRVSMGAAGCFRDSLQVRWSWFDANMQPSAETFGADSVTVEFSVDRAFAFRKARKTMAANGQLVLRLPDMPFVNEQNDVLYIRTRGVDRWGHVSPWSTDYPELGSTAAQFDAVPPAVTAAVIDSVKAPMLGGAGNVNVYLSWSDVADNCSGTWFYEILRNGVVVGRDTSRSATHVFADRAQNADSTLLDFRWQVHAVDSVGNRQRVATAAQIPVVLTAPDSIYCLNDTTVCWTAAASSVPNLDLQYVVEGARFAELLGNPLTNVFIGPVDSLCAAFSVPWESVFWRVKARVGDFESAWSDTFVCDLREFQSVAALQAVLQQGQNIPQEFALSQNYPNPFNPATVIEFSVKETAGDAPQVVIEIFNVAGQKVKTLLNAKKLPGNYSVIWTGQDDDGNVVSSGLYVYRMRVAGFVTTKKMLFLK